MAILQTLPEEHHTQNKHSTLIDQYLQSIYLPNREPPTLPYLNKIVNHHIDKYAFSSVNSFLGTADTLPLDTQSLIQRIVIQKRGGYCFEHNKLLFDVVKDLGFSVRLVLARVTLNKVNVRPGLTHRLTLVDFCSDEEEVVGEGCEHNHRHLDDDGKGRNCRTHCCYIVDVSFGDKVPCAPVPLWGEELKETDDFFRRQHRIHRDHDDPDPFHMQVFQKETSDWFTLYKFDPFYRYSENDCEIGHFFSYKNPGAIFVNHLYVSKRDKDKGQIRLLHNTSLKILSPSDDISREQDISSSGDLRQILREQFDIHVTEAESELLFKKTAAALRDST